MADVRDFLMPDLGEGLEEGEIVEWLVAVGDHIEVNDNVAVVETAKAAVEVPSPFGGTVVELLGEPGDTIEVGEPFIRIEVVEVAPSVAEGGDADLDDVAAPADRTATQASFDDAEEAPAEDEEEPQPLVGYGAGKAGPVRSGRAKRRRRGAEPAASGNGQATTKPLAKPPVRKLAKDLGVDLAAIAPGSGEGGIVTRDDVRAAAEAPARAEPAVEAPARAEPTVEEPAVRQRAAPTPAPEPVAATGGEKAVAGFRGRRPGEVEEIRTVRKRIVEKMETSRREIPEASASRTTDVTALWEVREQLQEQARAEGYDVKLTPFALVARAAVLALRRFPTLNARIDREAGEIRLLEPIHLGVAIDTDRGLLVPNVKDAHALSTIQLAAAIAELARKGRDGSLTPQELTGGTFTVNNYGAFGNDVGDPIINHPEAAILGVGAMRDRPWVVDGELAVRRVATFTIAFDHRVCDGGEAGRFITYVADLCEQPARILLHS